MSASAGLNRETLQPLTDFDHVRQSLNVIFTTRLMTRVLRRYFGSAVPGLLGKPLTAPQILQVYMAIVIAVELWEARFTVTSIDFPANENSASGLQQGKIGMTINGAYRPYALNGDFTIAGNFSVVL